MKRFEMAFPETVSEACSLLEANPDSRPIAGGTALSVVMKEGVYNPERLINIRGLEPALRYVDADDEAIRIGALTTLHEVEEAEAVREHVPTVADCLGEIAGVRVRNRATVGGHLAHADLHLDLPPVLAGLDATVVVTDGEGTRRLPVGEFMRGYYETALETGELLSELAVPIPDPGTRGAYLKHRYFSEVDWPCVGVAAFAVATDGGFEDVRVLLNSVGRRPVMTVEGIDDVLDPELSEGSIDEAAALAREQASPASDIRGSREYKERMAAEFTRRALRAVRDGEGDGR